MPQRPSWNVLQNLFNRAIAEHEINELLVQVDRWRETANDKLDICLAYVLQAGPARNTWDECADGGEGLLRDASADALASIDRVNASDHFRVVSRGAVTLIFRAGVLAWPLTCPAACPGCWSGWAGVCRRAWAGARDRVGAGQAAWVSGGPQAASNRCIHSAWRCQPAGRCRVRWPRPCRAVRAARLIRSRRIVAPLALAWDREARHPAARVRLCVMPR